MVQEILEWQPVRKEKTGTQTIPMAKICQLNYRQKLTDRY